MDKYAEIRVPIDRKNPSIKRRESKCVLCGKCKDICKKQMGVAGFWKYDSEDIVCINCGQCANGCPMRAISEQDDTQELINTINDKDKKVAVITSPAVRVSLGEVFGLSAGEFVQGKMVGTLKQLGVDYVFDTAFGADLTTMEEASELLERVKTNSNLPQFTSCCPAWVKFVETFYPQYIKNLSTCRSPISMLASVLKNYFAKEIGVEPQNLVVVALTPCVAKKFEAKRDEFRSDYGFDTNVVISVREFGRLLEEKGIDLNGVTEAEFDEPFSKSSGAGMIFGASGGVMESAVRCAYYMATKQQPPIDLLEFKALRGYKDVKTASVELLGKKLNLCVIFGTNTARKILDNLQNEHFDMIEVMACPNGCVGGGGQPINQDVENLVKNRAEGLYKKDKCLDLRVSSKNPQIQQLYKNFLDCPLSEKAEKYLHTTYKSR